MTETGQEIVGFVPLGERELSGRRWEEEPLSIEHVAFIWYRTEIEGM